MVPVSRFAFLALLAMALAGVSHAEEGQDKEDDTAADENKEGEEGLADGEDGNMVDQREDQEQDQEIMLSLEEQAKDALMQLDKDKNGKVTKDEFDAALAELATDGDAAENLRQATSVFNQQFMTADRNGDNSLEVSELMELVSMLAEDHEANEHEANQIFEHLDRNKDDKISKEEYNVLQEEAAAHGLAGEDVERSKVHFEEHFASADKNGDASLDRSELMELVVSFRGEANADLAADASAAWAKDEADDLAEQAGENGAAHAAGSPLA